MTDKVSSAKAFFDSVVADYQKKSAECRRTGDEQRRLYWEGRIQGVSEVFIYFEQQDSKLQGCCHYCKQKANELTQKADWPPIVPGTGAPWVCDACLEAAGAS